MKKYNYDRINEFLGLAEGQSSIVQQLYSERYKFSTSAERKAQIDVEIREKGTCAARAWAEVYRLLPKSKKAEKSTAFRNMLDCHVVARNYWAFYRAVSAGLDTFTPEIRATCVRLLISVIHELLMVAPIEDHPKAQKQFVSSLSKRGWNLE